MLDTTTLREQLLKDPWSVPIEDVDPSYGDLFFHQKHHDVFRRLREEDPVHFTEGGVFGPYWSITKYNHLVEVDSNHKVFSSEPTIVIGDLQDDFPVEMFIAMDPPKHDVQRKAAQPAVAPQRLSELEDLIRQRVCTILDGLPRNEEFNWVDVVSRELTMQMLATLFDFPFDERHLLTEWSDASTTSELVGVEGVDEEARIKSLMEALAYFRKLFAERKAQPMKYDFLSLMAHDPNTKDMDKNAMEFLGNMMLLIVGGNDTTRNSISGGLVALNENPGEYDKLRADHSLIPNMVSEIIRWQTPLSHMRRNALEDIEFHGKQIRKGDKVVLWYCSGNRDDEVIKNANVFQIDRKRARQHVAFGFGVHRCMGNRTAEMQLRILWEEIMNRFDKIEVVGEPVRIASNFVNGFDEVIVNIPG